MGLLWETYIDGTHYSVRSAGKTVRLYSNGVFHSQWNENRPFSGAIWDCLSLPVLYRAPENTKNILMLGLGGGASVRQLQRLVPFENLTAVEIDAAHIDIAQRWFGVASDTIELVHGNAIEWVTTAKTHRFDLIIDDLFGHAEGEPVRAQAITDVWVAELSRHLTPEAVLVVNCISRQHFAKAVVVFKRAGFAQAYRWTLSEYDNAIGVFFRLPVPSGTWLQHLQEIELPAAMRRQARQIKRKLVAL